MRRTPRRTVEPEPTVTPLPTALDHVRNGTWPSVGDRNRFWNQARIPVELHEVSRPDPRRILLGDAERMEYHRDLNEWEQARIHWLEEEAHHG